ncbi:MAG: hypothetical protein KF819_02365 [Labilithrix sp.]|nr:hypothetical protein [Labilithrix sp.]
MNNPRLRVFRAAVDGLIESLDAVVRLASWKDGEEKPAPLLTSVAKLQDRLGAAERLAGSHFSGRATDVATVTEMRAVLRRLDAAHLAYCKRGGSGEEKNEAMIALATEVAATTALAHRWA